MEPGKGLQPNVSPAAEPLRSLPGTHGAASAVWLCPGDRPSHQQCRQPLPLPRPGLLGAEATLNGCRSWGLGASGCKTLTTFKLLGRFFFFPPGNFPAAARLLRKPSSPPEMFCIYSQQGNRDNKAWCPRTHTAQTSEKITGVPAPMLGCDCYRTAPLASICCFLSLSSPPPCFLVLILFLLAHKADEIRKDY